MASALNALPTITATALGASLATGIAAGQYKAPTAIVGLTVPMDSVNFYVENQDTTSSGGSALGGAAGMIFVQATATSTQNGTLITNTTHKGANIYIAVSSVAATCTIGLNIQVSDPNTGFYTINRISLDGQTGSSNSMFQIYPGIGSVPFAVGSVGATSQALARVWRVVASVTATASAGGASTSLNITCGALL